MSISSEISRISQNVADSLEQVALKGVTVPSGSTSDDLPDLIAQITGGGSGGIVISDTTDAAGGTVRTITATEISGTKQITQNGVEDVTSYAAVNVQVPTGGANLQAKTNISPTTSSQTITPDSGYDGLSSVQINAMPSGTATAPASISGTSATVSTGTNTLTLTKTVSVTPSVTAGYVSSGTAGNSSVSLTASVTTKGTTVHGVSSNDETIASGTYLTGSLTIKAVKVSGLSADTLLSGTTVKIGDAIDDDRITSVTGNVVIQHYYTGSSTPSSSTGVNGDIYLKTS